MTLEGSGHFSMKALNRVLHQALMLKVNGLGLGLFRIAFALVALQEVIFLFYFRHLIFDPLPYIDRASPVLHVLLLVWMFALICLALGYHTQRAALANYAFWVMFVIFTPMWQDFDGGFDQLMTGSSLLLIFLPSARRLALDPLRARWREGLTGPLDEAETKVPLLAVLLPLGLSLGLLYLDSGLHKLSSEFWRNGMGAWLPSTMPYYMSPIDMSPLLEQPLLERGIGYTVMGFQLLFLFLFWIPALKPLIFLLGTAFHTGIILSLNVYPFGFAMLVHYFLLIPGNALDRFEQSLRVRAPRLRIYYDEQCPLCRRTVLVLSHLDIRHALQCLPLGEHAMNAPELARVCEADLLKDLYSIDDQGRLKKGFETYRSILVALGYTAPLGLFLGLPGIAWAGRTLYRKIADQRLREPCDQACLPEKTENAAPSPLIEGFMRRFARDPAHLSRRLGRLLIGVLLLQLNCTLHYGLLYRWAGAKPEDPWLALLDQTSDQIINLTHAFLGISPHALYLHDHFDHYTKIVAITYQPPEGEELWLPFVNREGRLLAPNWGRIQSMWANVAVTSNLDGARLERFSRKVTAFYAQEMGIRLDHATFQLKVKSVEVPTDWAPQVRSRNLRGEWQPLGTLSWDRNQGHLTLIEPLGFNGRDRRDSPEKIEGGSAR